MWAVPIDSSAMISVSIFSSTFSHDSSFLMSFSGVEHVEARRLTAGEQMKAEEDFLLRLQQHDVEMQRWRRRNGLYETSQQQLERDFGPDSFARLMSTFTTTVTDGPAAQFGARGLCNCVSNSCTKK
jgi:hypothetical protein